MDKRGSLYKCIQKRIATYRKALGRDISPQKQWIIEDIAKTEGILDGVDFCFSTLVSPISKGRPRPALEIRLRLAAHIKDNLSKLGLDKVRRRRNAQG